MLAIRVPDEWRQRLKVEAALRGTTMAKLVVRAVDEYLERNPVREASTNGEESR